MTAYRRGNYATALQNWRQLAETNNAHAQFSLGVMYASGTGVPQELVTAYMWFELADIDIGEASLELENIAQKMTPDQIAEAKKLAIEWRAEHPVYCHRPRGQSVPHFAAFEECVTLFSLSFSLLGAAVAAISRRTVSGSTPSIFAVTRPLASIVRHQGS